MVSALFPCSVLCSTNNRELRGPGLTEAQVAALAPPLGWTAGVNPKPTTGTCDGAVDDENGIPIQIPCDCPPSQDVYISDLTANANAGFAVNNTVVAVTFPTDSSIASQLARLTAASITLQNLGGPGAGCPVTSTTFVAQQAALQEQAGMPPPPPTGSTSALSSSTSSTPASIPSSTPPSAPISTPTSTPTSPATPSGVPSNDTIIALTPLLGWTAGISPKEGNGNCDGFERDSTGQPVQVPCSCPPSQSAFNTAMIINVDAGHAVNNSADATPFPTDSSAMSTVTRLFAAIATLQNLFGPGAGCPVSSTTLSVNIHWLKGTERH
ncbi:hypothetical protein K488DRAFT_43778 [Vararia minispora EC-137]|uniref:Uncharacterized protein n=1 Tax=Vararia minispora EC-137 TaxID=1314806 RepID=A0ACB8QTT0_9AGAM|nr:hypothetical protein K488DRAFT_43778 [Vararia minispora EC-137]